MPKRRRISARISRAKWVSWRSALLRRRTVPSPPCRPFTCPPTITRTLLPPPRSRTSTPPPTFRAPSREFGIYPAVDPLASTSRILDPRILGDEHYDTAQSGERRVAALQGPAGHHRHSRHRRIEATKTSRRIRAPAKSSVSFRSPSTWPSNSPASRANT